jgi:hypothetical protein
VPESSTSGVSSIWGSLRKEPPTYSYNVYKVPAESSIVTTFVGYIDIPLDVMEQKVILIAPSPGACDGFYFGECQEIGAQIKKRRRARTYQTNSVWGLSYQEGEWIVTRRFGPKSAAAFVKSVRAARVREILGGLLAGLAQ